jgi:hypothetical protein
MTKEEEAAASAKAEAEKVAQEAAKKADEDDDVEIADIMKDKDAVKKLRDAKRAANSESKARRLENEQLKAELKAIRDKEAEAEKKKLEEQGQYKTLLEAEKAEKEKIKAENDRKILNMHIRLEAVQAGIIDQDDKNLDGLVGVSIDADGKVVGAKEAVLKLKTAKAHLFSSGTTSTSAVSGTNSPAAGGGQINWKYLRDHPAETIKIKKENPALYESLKNAG